LILRPRASMSPATPSSMKMRGGTRKRIWAQTTVCPSPSKKTTRCGRDMPQS
jgi:hypothetical protein